jgi:hypothetical protein
MHGTVLKRLQFRRNGSCNVANGQGEEVTFVEFGEAGGRQLDVFRIGLEPGYARTYNSSDHSCLNNLRRCKSPNTSMSSSFD